MIKKSCRVIYLFIKGTGMVIQTIPVQFCGEFQFYCGIDSTIATDESILTDKIHSPIFATRF